MLKIDLLLKCKLEYDIKFQYICNVLSTKYSCILNKFGFSLEKFQHALGSIC